MENDEIRNAFLRLMSERGWSDELKKTATATYDKFILRLQPWPHIISNLHVEWRDEEEDLLVGYEDDRLQFGASFYEDGFTLSYDIYDGNGDLIVGGMGSDEFYLTSPMFEDFAAYLRGDYRPLASRS